MAAQAIPPGLTYPCIKTAMTPSPRIVAGNWKMNKTVAEAKSWLARFLESYQPSPYVEVQVYPSFTALHTMALVASDRSIRVGGQNIHEEDRGAYTGEVSAVQLREAGADVVLIGHSERRLYAGETDAMLARKMTAAIYAGLQPVLCVGENREDRETHRHEDVVGYQLEQGLAGWEPTSGVPLVIAYEPVWAIGTGMTATPRDAGAMHAHIRRTLNKLPVHVPDVRILYGGSVTPSNVGELFATPGIDGVLVGGASLDPLGFLEIVRAAQRLR